MAKMHPPPHDAQTSSLAGKQAVVTGASSGIGRAIALELANAGADVFVHARRNQSGAAETVAAIESLGRVSQMYLADIADAKEATALVNAAFDWRKNISIWVNCAGVDVLTGEAAKESFDEKLHALWQADVRGTMQICRDVGQQFRERSTPEATLLNIGWDQAEQGMAGDSGEMFAAVKGAVMAFTKSLAKSLAPDVRVNCVAPGWIKTSWGEEASEYWQQRAISESLLARWGTPDDVARVVRFLVSPAAGFVNGQIICVNGGLGTIP